MFAHNGLCSEVLMEAVRQLALQQPMSNCTSAGYVFATCKVMAWSSLPYLKKKNLITKTTYILCKTF